MSWYKTDKQFTIRQKKYFSLLEKTFSIGDAKGEFMDYKPLDYQKEMHATTPMALQEDDWKNVFVFKGRGIGASRVRMMDLILHCLQYKGIVFPIVVHRQDTGIEWLKVAQELIMSSKVDLAAEFEQPFTKTEILCKRTGSKIKIFPANNIHALRFIRTLMIVLDEICFFRDIKGVLSAAESCINQGGVLIGQSTVFGRNNYFWELYEEYQKTKTPSSIVQYFPVFDPDKFRSTENILDQVAAGIKPIGFWYNIKKLEEDRHRDLPSFLQENQIIPISDTESWYPMSLTMSCVSESLKNSDEFTTINPIVIGIDFGLNHDFTSISIFEKTENGLIHRFQQFIKGMPMPDQRMVIEHLIDKLKPTRVRTDMTGIGTGISQELAKKYGGIIEPIHFTKPIKEKMATELKTLMGDGNIKLLNDSMVVKHLSAVNFELKSIRDSEEGHADAAWSIALATLPEGHQAKNMVVNAAFGKARGVTAKKEDNRSVIERFRREREKPIEEKTKEIKKISKEKENKFKKVKQRLKELQFACTKRGEILTRSQCVKCSLKDCKMLETTKTLVRQGGIDYEEFKEWNKENNKG